MMRISIREFSLVLVLLLTAAFARQHENSVHRRTAIRGVSTPQHSVRELGVGHGGRDNGGKGKSGKGKGSSGKGDESSKNGRGGSSKDKRKDDHDEEDDDSYIDSEDLPTAKDQKSSDDNEDSEGKNPKGGPGAVGQKGAKKGEGKGKEKGNEHSEHENVETFRRDVPDFTISYVIPSSRKAEIPQAADYNELSVVSEEFLDRMFGSVFEDLAVGHYGTAAYVMTNEGAPFLVSFRVTLDFTMPGEVPTVQFLINRVQEAFEGESSRATYLFDLNTMSETNPFSATTSFRLIAASGNSNDGLIGGPGTNKPPKVSTEDSGMMENRVMISLLAGIGILVLVLAGFLWAKGHKKPKFAPTRQSNSSSTLPFYNGKLGIEDRDHETERSGSIEEYGADDETVQYLNSLRERYKDQIVESVQGAETTIGYQDIVDAQPDIIEETDGILLLQQHQPQTVESTYGGASTTLPTEQKARSALSVRDLLNMELNSTDPDLDDDLGSVMN
ncbi:hypothetical protein IV203_015149 [Nitzschia inconspicua]|uniref:SEA domain-containing protein n=1 Tax=Nitzschia inconspicua TaxID=303405 RepID=A0A9K3LB76_9STRA|nr:hypothetical protein IV203_015149 [Nitzschia inconspicua]